MSLHKTTLKMRFKFSYLLLKKALPSYDSSVGGNSNTISPPPTQHLLFASLGETTPCFDSQCKSGPAWKLLPTEFKRRCKRHVPDFQTEKNSKAKTESPQRTWKFAFGPICFKGTATRSQWLSIQTMFTDQNLKYWINSGFLIWEFHLWSGGRKDAWFLLLFIGTKTDDMQALQKQKTVTGDFDR